jgi:hypothetical protein
VCSAVRTVPEVRIGPRFREASLRLIHQVRIPDSQP